ncbi:two-component sensor histidine kinase [Cellulomonas sp. APG4]|nr:two-component sensor histidine kinase [Cellulomonas sp. APG4]
MDGLLLLGVGVLGVVVGLTAAFAFRWSERAQRGAPDEAPEPELGDGATAVLAALRSATVVLDQAQRVVRASTGARSLGLVRDDRVVAPELRALLTEVARDGEIRDTEVELPRGPLGPATVYLHVRAAPLGARHVLLLAEDRTEARRVEEIRRDFVVNVSHELKTPVGALALLAETVEQAADDPAAVRTFASRMQTEATRLSRLVQEIIELSRLQVAGALTEGRQVEVADVVREAVDRAATKAAAKAVEIDVGDLPGAVVFGDQDLLVTAVRNLLDNAVAYSDDGTRVAVGCTLRAEDGLVEIAVVDQGVGIPPEDQPRLFERFYRVDPARSRDTGGTGLGLSIVKHVAADHGGDVTVWSEPGHGSTFTLRLPLATTVARGARTPRGER